MNFDRTLKQLTKSGKRLGKRFGKQLAKTDSTVLIAIGVGVTAFAGAVWYLAKRGASSAKELVDDAADKVEEVADEVTEKVAPKAKAIARAATKATPKNGSRARAHA